MPRPADPALLETPAVPVAHGRVLPLLFAGYLFAKPFYVVPGASPQPADVLVVVLCAIELLRGRIRLDPRLGWIAFSAVCFVGYAIFVNGVWSILLGEDGMLKKAVPFYLFNLAILLLALHLYSAFGERFFRYTAYGVLGSVLLQFALSFAFSDPHLLRQVLFFRNPNQLGYWALLSGCIFFACARRVSIPFGLQLAFALSVGYVAALSLSKAALISMGFLFVLAFAHRARALALVACVAVAVYVAAGDAAIFGKASRRLADIGEQQDDSLSGRGYDRIWENPRYLLLGSGEGSYWRFSAHGLELHSTAGTLLFSYGLCGTLLFLGLLWRVFREGGVSGFRFLLPAFLFGMAHQGLRMSLLWVLFAVVAASNPGARRPRRLQPAAPGPALALSQRGRAPERAPS